MGIGCWKKREPIEIRIQRRKQFVLWIFSKMGIHIILGKATYVHTHVHGIVKQVGRHVKVIAEDSRLKNKDSQNNPLFRAY